MFTNNQLFIDSSVILRLVLGNKNPYFQLSKNNQLYASEILKVECKRNIDRLRLKYHWNAEETAVRFKILEEVLQKLEEIQLDKNILQRACEPFSTPLKTLDAIHIATAIKLKESLDQPFLFVTHDRQQGIAAMACGFETDGY